MASDMGRLVCPWMESQPPAWGLMWLQQQLSHWWLKPEPLRPWEKLAPSPARNSKSTTDLSPPIQNQNMDLTGFARMFGIVRKQEDSFSGPASFSYLVHSLSFLSLGGWAPRPPHPWNVGMLSEPGLFHHKPQEGVWAQGSQVPWVLSLQTHDMWPEFLSFQISYNLILSFQKQITTFRHCLYTDANTAKIGLTRSYVALEGKTQNYKPILWSVLDKILKLSLSKPLLEQWFSTLAHWCLDPILWNSSLVGQGGVWAWALF